MLKNYFITAWRHLVTHRLFSIINVFGLSVGLASCIMILIFVDDELSHDKWLPDGDRIVRMHSSFFPPDRPPFLTVRSPGRMMEALRDNLPDMIENGVRLVEGDVTVLDRDRAFSESVLFADPSFFDIFQLPFAAGDAVTAFRKPLDLVISESTAHKYFGTTNAVGKRLTFCCVRGERIDLSITGVIRDLPANTHFDPQFLVYMDPALFAHAPNILDTWTSVNTYTYFKKKPGVSTATLESSVMDWLATESPLKDQVPPGVDPRDMAAFPLMAVPDIYLNARTQSGSMGDLKPLGDIRQVYAFSGIALLILIIASINFMNLATARASRRAREVALRKVMGATRAQVSLQFLGEAIGIALVSLLFALVAVEVLLPTYNEAIGRELQFDFTAEPLLLLGMLATTVIVGLVSGSYPAVFLSRFLPARIMKANQSSEPDGQGQFRALLVIFQFAVSIGLAVCTLTIYTQTMYARSMDVGYNYDQKLVLHGIRATEVREQHDALARELAAIPGVTSVVLSSEVPSQDNENNTFFRRLDTAASEGVQEAVVLNYHTFGYDFFEAYDMQLLAGRSFDEAFGTDTTAVVAEGEIGRAGIVINEAAMNRLGFESPEEAVGKTLRADVVRSGPHDLEIIGVAKDVYFRSIKFGVRPTVFFNNPDAMREATISFEPGTIPAKQLTQEVEEIWRRLAPNTPISYETLSDMVHRQYLDEERQAQMFAVFSVLAVVIACLGLFGLASFTAERRTREIGLRKVMGARIRDILTLLIWQFSIPVLIANVIAWPVAWYVMNDWLAGFTYRIDNSYVIIASIGAGLGALVIAWFTVAARALKVATANPIAALRYE